MLFLFFVHPYSPGLVGWDSERGESIALGKQVSYGSRQLFSVPGAEPGASHTAVFACSFTLFGLLFAPKYLGDGMEKHREDDGVVFEQDGKVHDPNDMAGRRSTRRRVGEGRCRLLCTIRLCGAWNRSGTRGRSVQHV